MKVCKNCNKFFGDEVKFCPLCGSAAESVVQEKICPNCGQLVKEKDIFCTHCGAKIGAAPVTQTQPQNTAEGEAATPVPPQNTAEEAGTTPVPPQNTVEGAAATPVPPQNTAEGAVTTPVPPQNTAEGAAATPVPPQNTAEGAGTTPVPPQNAAGGAMPPVPPQNTIPVSMPPQYPTEGAVYGQGFVPEMSVTQEKANGSFFKRHKLAVAIPLVLVILAVSLTVFAFAKTSKFEEYVENYKKQCKALELGEYQDEYDDSMEASKDIIKYKAVWKIGKQEDKMEAMRKEVTEMNQKIAEYKKDYDKVIAALETSEHYFLGNYETEYETQKRDFSSALEKFDVDSCKNCAEKFETLLSDVIKEDKKEVEEYVKEVSGYQNSSNYSCENYIINKYSKKIVKAQKNENYAQAQTEYNKFSDYTNQLDNITNSYAVIDDYAQVDVSEKGKVSLYLQSDDDNLTWKYDAFRIYEQTKKGWSKCKVESVEQVKDKGGLSIDIVADVSSSMSDVFYDVTDTMTSFVNAVDSGTRLGLAELSSVYTRKETFTSNKSEIAQVISALECHGSTALYHTLYSSVVYTASSTGARCVVAFTDGLNVPYDDSYDYSEKDVIEAAKTYNVPVYLIGMGSEVDEDTLRYIASSTGGAYWSIDDVYELDEIYNQIYEDQQKMYCLTYRSSLAKSKDRDVYVGYYNENDGNTIRLQTSIHADSLEKIYSTVTGDSLADYYTKDKLLTSEELDQISGLDDLQTVINIYYAKNGYRFGSEDALKKIIKTGAVSKNGNTTDMAKVEKKIRKNKKLYKNYRALLKRRSAIIYDATWEEYYEGISKKELIRAVHDRLGESNKVRYKNSILAAYKNIREN